MRHFSENFFSSSNQRLQFSVCIPCLYSGDDHDVARHLQASPGPAPLAQYWRSQGTGLIACLRLARQKNSNLDWETSQREKGANTVLWIVIFTRDHATIVLIITCELMQIQNTALSHTQPSHLPGIVSTQLASS